MSGLSRRDFFSRLAHGLSDQLNVDRLRRLAAGASAASARRCENPWVVVGSLADFAPGAVREVTAHGHALQVLSSPVGISAQDSQGRSFALRHAGRGVIEINPQEEWGRRRVLSHATGEPIDLDQETPVGEKL